MAEEQTNIKPFPTGASTSGPTRQMPHNLPAEQNLLGALLLDNSVMERIDDRLRDEHFYDPLHGRIFQTIMRMTERGQLANPVTLKSFFTGTDDFPDTDAQDYLTDLADGVISISQAPDYAHTIHEAHLRRELILISDQVITDAIQPEVDTPASTQIETAEAHLFRLAENDTVSN